MQVIWKEELEILENQSLMIPKGATILTVQMQRGVPCIWFRVPELPVVQKEVRTFAWYGTGHITFIEGTYIGTIQSHGENLVFHLYETTYRV